MSSWRRNLVFGFTAAAFAAGGYGVAQAIHSPLFLVRVVEVSPEGLDRPDEAPLGSDAISELAGVPLGQVNLFDLDLKPIERRLLSNPWIRSVRLQKRFPQTLSIGVDFREPAALIQGADGNLSYVDRDGETFAPANIAYRADLPIVTGLRMRDPAVPGAVKIVTNWERSPVGRWGQIASIGWDGDRGYRALMVYPVKNLGLARAWVDLGDAPENDHASETQLSRLSQVVHYLSQNGVMARQIWADAGKKIVVKTAHGS